MKRTAALATALALVAVGCGTSTRRSATPTTATSTTSTTLSTTSVPAQLIVDGRAVPAVGVATVGEALAAASVDPTDGRLTSLVSGRVLDAHADAATIILDGVPTTRLSPVHGGDVITRSTLSSANGIRSASAWINAAPVEPPPFTFGPSVSSITSAPQRCKR